VTRARHEGKWWLGLEILVVSPTPTHPQDHGNRKRIFEVCSELKRQGAKVHFVHYATEHDWRTSRPARWEREMVAAWDSYQLIAPSRPPHEAAVGSDHLIDEWADPNVSSYIRWAFAVRTYDAVLVEYTWMSFCLDAVPPGVFKICDTHDVFGGRRMLLERNGIAPEFFYTTPEEEKKGLARANLVWAIKDSERSYFESSLGIKACVTLLHVEPFHAWWTHRPSQDGWLRVGIIGARNNVNRRNLEAFLATTLPLIESYMAPVKLVIAGGCADDLRHLRHPNLEVVGRVPDVAEFYRNADVICAPVQFSTGLKIKVAEALASGAPLVAHRHAMEGFPTTHPLHDLPDFAVIARELVKLSFDPSGLPTLAAESVLTRDKTHSLVLDAIEDTRQRIVCAGDTSIAVVAPLDALSRSSLLHDHLCSALDYFRFAGPTILYITKPAESFDADSLSNLGFNLSIFVAPSLADQLGDALPDGWRPLELAVLIANRRIAYCYFAALDDQIANILPGVLRRIFVRYDAIALQGDDPRQAIELLASVAPVAVLSTMAIPVAGDSFEFVGPIPFRRKNAYVSLAHIARKSANAAGLVILADGEQLLTSGLQELAKRLGYSVEVIDLSDASAFRPGLASSKSGLRANIVDARLIADLSSESDTAAVIVEGAQRAGVPVIRLVRSQVAAALQQLHRTTTSISVGGFLRAVAGGLVDGPERNILIAAVRSEAGNLVSNDSGWAWLWKDMRERRGLAGTPSAVDALFG
jgi:glycosyltransferase involved in cell wall biosynthesis